jgi:1A family penicillin-binding protein
MRPRLIAAGVALFALVMIALVATWVWWTAARIDLRRLAEPSVVYAAARVLEPGVSVTTSDLAGTLERLGYQQVAGDPQAPGQFRRGADGWDIFLRASADPESARPAVRVRLDVKDDRVRAVVNAADGTHVDRVELEPEILGDLGDLTYRLRRPVRLASVPPHVLAAVFAAEDRRFFEHPGVDVWAIGRAMWVNLRRGGLVEGGSTITQQLVKSLDGGERTWLQKVRSALLAVALERRYSKAEILETYLNTVYLGQYGPVSMYGLGAAAITYFQKDLGDLDVAEAAMLAGMIRGPNRYSPVLNPYRARARRNVVLRRMREHGLVSPAVFDEAMARSVAGVQATPPRTPIGLQFFDEVLAQLAQMPAGTGARTGGLRIYTTLDPVLQRAAELVLAEKLEQQERRDQNLRRFERKRRLQGALIALDPATGEIRALVGSRDYWVSQFDRATQARRHPGSTFKPFVYLAALRGGPRGESPSLTAASLVQDAPLTVEDHGESWSLRKQRGFFLGQVTVRQALAHSLNAPAVSTAQHVGLEAVVRTARDVGFTSPMVARPALALGGLEVVPLELAAAYATLANAGVPTTPTTVRAVTNGLGSVIRPRRERGQAAVTPEEAYVITHLLRGVVDGGTAGMSKVLGLTVPAAGKTGSTDRDAWFVGYTPRLVTLVWVGFDDWDKLQLSGARGALPIWVEFMRTAADVIPSGPFPVPPSIVFRDIDVTTGKLATPLCRLVIREAFLPSAVPTEPCPEHGH